MTTPAPFTRPDQGIGWPPEPALPRRPVRDLDDLRRVLARVTTPCDHVEILGTWGPVVVRVSREIGGLSAHPEAARLRRVVRRLREAVGDCEQIAEPMASMGRAVVAVRVVVG